MKKYINSDELVTWIKDKYSDQVSEGSYAQKVVEFICKNINDMSVETEEAQIAEDTTQEHQENNTSRKRKGRKKKQVTQ